MEALLTYHGKRVTAEDAAFIRQLIEKNPGDSRRVLSQKLCEAWDWRQPNGVLRDRVCRGLMLALERAGHIEVPAPKKTPLNPLAQRKKSAPRGHCPPSAPGAPLGDRSPGDPSG